MAAREQKKQAERLNMLGEAYKSIVEKDYEKALKISSRCKKSDKFRISI